MDPGMSARPGGHCWQGGCTRGPPVGLHPKHLPQAVVEAGSVQKLQVRLAGLANPRQELHLSPESVHWQNSFLFWGEAHPHYGG